MKIKFFFQQIIILFSLVYFSSAIALPVSQVVPSVQVVGLSLSKVDPTSMFGDSTYWSAGGPMKGGTSILLLIHTNYSVFSIDPTGTQLTLKDNLGTDLIAAGNQRKVAWRAAHPTVYSVSTTTDNGISFNDSSVMKNGNNILILVNSSALPQSGATSLTVKGNVSVIPFTMAEQPSAINEFNVAVGESANEVNFNIHNQLVTMKLLYLEDGMPVYTITSSSLLLRKVEIFNAEDKSVLGNVVIEPGEQNSFKLPVAVKKVNLKIYYDASVKKVVIPVEVSTGVGI